MILDIPADLVVTPAVLAHLPVSFGGQGRPDNIQATEYSIAQWEDPFMQVRDYMSGTPVTINASADYQDALELMDQHHMHHLPVTDDQGVVVGILSRHDLQLAARYFHEHPGEINEVMHTPVTTIAPEAELADAVDAMTKGYMRCLPVSEDGGHQLVGIITETDLMRALRDLLAKQGG
ncbi:CBS domain-containing protein [Thioflavicoccus mobilis]|nr:CBS domain-containing protein [Thioflavicoccus mobilis]